MSSFYYVSIKSCAGSRQEPVWSAAPRSIGVSHAGGKEKWTATRKGLKKKKRTRPVLKGGGEYKSKFWQRCRCFVYENLQRLVVKRVVLVGLVLVLYLGLAIRAARGWRLEGGSGGGRKGEGMQRLSTHRRLVSLCVVETCQHLPWSPPPLWCVFLGVATALVLARPCLDVGFCSFVYFVPGSACHVVTHAVACLLLF